ncbi:MAG: YciI family protein [Ignavibacteriae bacterium]|nr:YciI family protein [Ignavibacteriota bacterium]
MSTHDHKLSPEEHKRFVSLSRHRVPPPHLEENIMNELRERELMKTESQSGWNLFSKIAAVLVFLIIGGVSGFLVGKSETTGSVPDPNNQLYVLLIRESPTSRGGQDLVTEYSQWAAGVHNSGRYITGEKLRDSGRILKKIGVSASSQEGKQILKKIDGSIAVIDTLFNQGEGELGGYFIIEAKDYDEAVKIASQCPHLKYGGTIELREIEPT